MKNIIFLMGLFPKEIRSEIEYKSNGVIQYAADALQWSLVQGIGNYSKNIKIVNLPYIGSFPTRYKDIKISSFNFSHNGISKDRNIGFINLPVYKLYSRYINAKKYLKKIIKNDDVIVIYSMHTSFIQAAVDLKNITKALKICLIVPDLPIFMGGKENFLRNILKKTEQNIQKKLLSHIDAFVLLSDYMYEPLNIKHRPWVRVEGIFNIQDLTVEVEKEKYKTILYSGTLAKRYGIMNLLDAFSMIKGGNYRLWICGEGDARKEIDERMKVDARIHNFGQIPREEVLKLQKRCTVLVNPRISEDEFTKYSFPSKTMEYLASGTPSIIYKLKGIPEEYFKYCYVAEEESSYGLYKTIVSVCNLEQEELAKFGEKAKQFILDNKTAEKQGKVIYDMLNNL